MTGLLQTIKISIVLAVIVGNEALELTNDEMELLGDLLMGFSIANFNPSFYRRNIGEFVKFRLFTRKNPDIFQTLDPLDNNTLRDSNFDFNKTTMFLIHGFLRDITFGFASDMKNATLQYRDVNVIAVDWKDIAQNLIYSVPVQLVPDVGRFIAAFIDQMVNAGVKLKDVHIMGFSLGGNIAGLSGFLMETGKPGRITGIDPALPGFATAGPERRIDSTHADFVDCIFTARGVRSFNEPICTANFYPNGGLPPQPGCNQITLGGCSHQRAYMLYAEALKPTNLFPVSVCPGPPNRRGDGCTPTSFFLGPEASPEMRGSYFVATNAEAPFAPVIQDE